MTEKDVKEQLLSYRQSIDNIDAALLHMLDLRRPIQRPKE